MAIKIQVNENLTSLINYIRELDHEVDFHEFVQFAIDYDCYNDMYANLPVLKLLIDDHNKAIQNYTWERPKQ